MKTIESDVRCAIVAPDRLNSAPGYYLLLKKLKDSDAELIFLSEVEEASPKALFEKLVEDEEEFRFNTIYIEPYPTGIRPPNFILSLRDYVKQSEHIPWIRICPTSFLYGNDIKQGVNLLDQWEGWNKIPEETVLWDQLEKIEPENFEDPIFYAFTALRYLLAGFKLDKTFFAIEDVEKNRAEVKRIDARKEIGSAACAAWDELRDIRKQIEDGEYYPEDY
jgi:hypothetical protein